MRPYLLMLFMTTMMTAQLTAASGRWAGDHPAWQRITPGPMPSVQERQAELAARQQDMEAQIAQLQERLQRAPDSELAERVRARLQAIHDNFGWVPETEMVYLRRCMDAMLRGQDVLADDLVAAFVQFRDDMAARDIDVIFVPLPPNPLFDLHRLFDDVGPEVDLYPGYSRMLLQLMQNDVEVIDVLDAFRQQAENPVLVGWVNDHHTASTGRAIVGDAINQRLQRYAWARDLQGNQAHWTETQHTRTGTTWPQRNIMLNRALTSVPIADIAEDQPSWPRPKRRDKRYILAPGAPENLREVLQNRTFDYLELHRSEAVDHSLMRTELMLLGDSNLHSPVFGSGLPEFINRSCGGLFRWASTSWGQFKASSLYLRANPDERVPPRVVVVITNPKYFWHTYDRDGNVARTRVQPVPLPPVTQTSGSGVQAASGATTVTITAVSATLNPDDLDYDEALIQVAAQITSGPQQGQQVAIRFWAMKDRQRIAAAQNIPVGTTLELGLQPWQQALQADASIGEHQIFDDTNVPLTVPVYWVIDGEWSPAAVLSDE